MRITDFPELVLPLGADLVVGVDVANDITKRIKLENLPVSIPTTVALATKQDLLVSGTTIKTLNSVSLLGSGNIVLTANASGVAGAVQFSDGSAFNSDASNLFWDNTNKRLGVGTNLTTIANPALDQVTQRLYLNASTGQYAHYIGSTVNAITGDTSLALFGLGVTSGGYSGGIRLFTSNSSITPVLAMIVDRNQNVGIGLTNSTNLTASARLHLIGSGATSATTTLLVQNSAAVTSLSILGSGLVGIGGVGNNGVLAINRASDGTSMAELYTTGSGFTIRGGASTLNMPNSSQNSIGTTVLSLGAMWGIQGSGSTSATTSLLVQNSSSSELLRVRDDGRVYIGTTGYFLPDTQSTTLYNFYNKIVLSSTEASNVVKVLLANDTHSFLSTNAGVFGKVGINTTTPTDTLAVNGASAGTFGITLIDGVNDRGRFWAGNGGTYLTGFNNGLFLGTYSINTAVKIDYLGNVGIGITSQTARLHVQGSGATSATTALLVQNSVGTAALTVRDDLAVIMNGLTITTLNASSNVNIQNTIIADSGQIYRNGNLALQSVSGVGNNNSVLINTTPNNTTVSTCAILGVVSTTKGFLPPVMTTTQRDAIVSPLAGLIVFNSTLGTLDIYDGATWQRFGQQTFIKGSGSTSATTSLLVQNSAGTTAMSILDSGLVNVGSLTGSGQLRFLEYLVNGTPFNFSTSSVFSVQGTSAVATSGTRDAFLGNLTFAQSSGTAIMNVFNASPTINQTGGANGITRGLYINPTLTAAADFRAIQTTAGKIIFGGLPTSSAGLVSGQIWNDAGTIKIV